MFLTRKRVQGPLSPFFEVGASCCAMVVLVFWPGQGDSLPYLRAGSERRVQSWDTVRVQYPLRAQRE